MYEESLKHNSQNSIIRRPTGLSDTEWNTLVVKTLERLAIDNELIFMQELVNVAKKENNQVILNILGIESIPYQNWGHASYRFFRHFCPENFRNALSHSGLPFATLEREEGEFGTFAWTSSVTFKVKNVTKILAAHDIKVGDKVIISAVGESDIDWIYFIVNEGVESRIINYYEKGKTKSFGNTMYFLKKAILLNTKEELCNSTLSQKD